MPDALLTATGITLAICLVYFKLKGLARLSRELKRNPRERMTLLVLLAAIPIMVGSCVTIERLTGVSPEAHEPSYVVRQAVSLTSFLAYPAFAWWYTVRPETLRRRDFAGGRLCPACNRPVQQNQLHHPILDGTDEASEAHWFHRGACGEWTLYHPDGRAQHVEDRTEAGAG